MRHVVTWLLPAVAAFAFSAPSRAQVTDAPPTLTVTVENRTAMGEAEAGAPRPDSTARAGDVLRYHLTFTNALDRQVRAVVLTNPIPAGTRFLAGSTRATREDARVEYSADHGGTYSAEPTEEVREDGRLVTRPVPPERYTDVRWTVDGWVVPGATVSAQFEVRIPPRTRLP